MPSPSAYFTSDQGPDVVSGGDAISSFGLSSSAPSNGTIPFDVIDNGDGTYLAVAALASVVGAEAAGTYDSGDFGIRVETDVSNADVSPNPAAQIVRRPAGGDFELIGFVFGSGSLTDGYVSAGTSVTFGAGDTLLVLVIGGTGSANTIAGTINIGATDGYIEVPWAWADESGGSVESGAGSITAEAVVSGVGASTAASAGSIAGAASVSGVGLAISDTDSAGSISGAATVSGVGASIAASAGSADGAASVSGVSFTPVVSGVGTAAGSSTVAGAGERIVATTPEPVAPSGGGMGGVGSVRAPSRFAAAYREANKPRVADRPIRKVETPAPPVRVIAGLLANENAAQEAELLNRIAALEQSMRAEEEAIIALLLAA